MARNPKATFAIPTTDYASVNFPHGTTPTSPEDGDVWSTTGGVYARVNGATVLLGTGGGIPLTDGDKGDVTVSGSGLVWTIDNGVVSNTKLADVATQTFKGRTTAGTGSPEDLTTTQATALLNAMVGDSGSGGTKGLVPAPAAGDAAANKFLMADGTWANTSGTGAAVDASWNFNTSTSAADPGNRKFAVNNATLASVTEIYFNDTTTGGFDASTLLGFLSAGQRIFIQQTNDATRAALFQVAGAATDNTGWWTVPVSVVSSGTLYQNNQTCVSLFILSSSSSTTSTGGTTVAFIEGIDPPEEPMVIPGPPGPAGANGVIGRNGDIIFLEPDEPELPMLIPGPQGATGATGSNGSPGAQGTPGVSVFVTDGEDGLDGMPVPGPQGIQGPAGSNGAPGIQGLPGVGVLVIDGEDGQDGMPIPGPAGQNGTAGSVAAPFTGNYAPGSFTIATTQFGIHGRRLTLTTTQRGTIAGEGRLSVKN